MVRSGELRRLAGHRRYEGNGNVRRIIQKKRERQPHHGYLMKPQ